MVAYSVIEPWAEAGVIGHNVTGERGLGVNVGQSQKREGGNLKLPKHNMRSSKLAHHKVQEVWTRRCLLEGREMLCVGRSVVGEEPLHLHGANFVRLRGWGRV